MVNTHIPRVVAIVVAYNRSVLLAECLEALVRQTITCDRILVIDNASSDDSAMVAQRFAPAVELYSLERNTGGAGGFAAGLALGIADADWLWLMDDDTIPHPDALEKLLLAVQRKDIVAAGSRVVWTDGSEHPMNTPREKPFVSRREGALARAEGLMAVRSTSFVSMLVRADRVREVGLPIADYFIWNDDFEYSTRLLRRQRGVHVPQSIVVHKTAGLVGTDGDPGPRFYYEVRNKLWMLRASASLNPLEKLMYGASSVRRWLRTYRRSADRSVLRDGFRRGVRDGLGRRPVSNVEFFADMAIVGEVQAAETSARG